MNTAGVYRRGEVIGRGNFGVVYKGINTETGKVVAIKTLDLDTAHDEVTDVQYEISLLAQLSNKKHSNITKYYGSILQGTKLWIIMDFCAGGSVRTLLKAGPLDERHLAVICRELCVAIATVHAEGIIHRDIKAANVLITTSGQLRLCDFGVAAPLSKRTKRTTIVGTPYWMAPEVVMEGISYNSKADIWSLGITIYEMTTGNPPYSDQEAVRALLLISKSQPPRLEGPNYSSLLKDLVALCLDEDPQARPTAEDILKHKFIKMWAKTPTSILRELVLRYRIWKERNGNARDSMLMAPPRSGEGDYLDAASEESDWDFSTDSEGVVTHEAVPMPHSLDDAPDSLKQIFGIETRPLIRPIMTPGPTPLPTSGAGEVAIKRSATDFFPLQDTRQEQLQGATATGDSGGAPPLHQSGEASLEEPVETPQTGVQPPLHLSQAPQLPQLADLGHDYELMSEGHENAHSGGSPQLRAGLELREQTLGEPLSISPAQKLPPLGISTVQSSFSGLAGSSGPTSAPPVSAPPLAAAAEGTTGTIFSSISSTEPSSPLSTTRSNATVDSGPKFPHTQTLPSRKMSNAASMASTTSVASIAPANAAPVSITTPLASPRSPSPIKRSPVRAVAAERQPSLPRLVMPQKLHMGPPPPSGPIMGTSHPPVGFPEVPKIDLGMLLDNTPGEDMQQQLQTLFAACSRAASWVAERSRPASREGSLGR